MIDPVDVRIELDPEKFTVSIVLCDIPMEHLEGVLGNMAKPSWRQNILDGIRGALAGKELGIYSTERNFQVDSTKQP